MPVTVSSSASIAQVEAKGATTLHAEGAVAAVTAEAPVTVASGTVESVTVPDTVTGAVPVTVSSSASIEQVEAKGAAKITTENNAVVGAVAAQADVAVSGSGSVNAITVPADTEKAVNITVGSGATVAEVVVSSDKGTTISGAVKNVSAAGDAAKESITGVNDDQIASHIHSWGAEKVTKEATCLETGVKTYSCTETTCSSETTKTETIPALGHKWGSWTAVDDTNHTRACQRDPDHIEKEPHVWGEGVESGGVRTFTCTECGTTKTENLSAALTWAEPGVLQWSEVEGAYQYRIRVSAGDKKVYDNVTTLSYNLFNYMLIRLHNQGTTTYEVQVAARTDQANPSAVTEIGTLSLVVSESGVPVEYTMQASGNQFTLALDQKTPDSPRLGAWHHVTNDDYDLYQDLDGNALSYSYGCSSLSGGDTFDLRVVTASSLKDGAWYVTMTPASEKTHHVHTVEEIPGTAATCTDTGLTAGQKCAVCGEILKAQETIPALGHDWGGWHRFDGTSHQRVCLRDQAHTETEAHVWNDGEVNKEPTAVTEGEMLYTCTVCTETRTEKIPIPGMYWLRYGIDSQNGGLVLNSNLPATNGKYQLVFSNASDSYRSGIGSDDYRTYPLSTMFAGKGIETYTRLDWKETVDGLTRTLVSLDKTLAIDVTGTPVEIRSFSAVPNAQYSGQWDMVIETDAALDENGLYLLYHTDNSGGSGCSPLSVSNGKLTATTGSSSYAEGVTLYVLKASARVETDGYARLTYTPNGSGYFWKATGSACTEHQWGEGSVTKEPTCTEKGIRTFTCSVCGAIRTEDIAVLDHTVEDIPGTDPSCTDTGLTAGQKCSVCGENLKPQETIPALGHTGDWVKVDDESHRRVCTVCLTEETGAHQWTDSETAENTKVCALCGATKTETTTPPAENKGVSNFRVEQVGDEWYFKWDLPSDLTQVDHYQIHYTSNPVLTFGEAIPASQSSVRLVDIFLSHYFMGEQNFSISAYGTGGQLLSTAAMTQNMQELAQIQDSGAASIVITGNRTLKITGLQQGMSYAISQFWPEPKAAVMRSADANGIIELSNFDLNPMYNINVSIFQVAFTGTVYTIQHSVGSSMIPTYESGTYTLEVALPDGSTGNYSVFAILTGGASKYLPVTGNQVEVPLAAERVRLEFWSDSQTASGTNTEDGPAYFAEVALADCADHTIRVAKTDWTQFWELFYDANGGTIGNSTSTFEHVTAMPATLPTPVWEGHIFQGWYLSGTMTRITESDKLPEDQGCMSLVAKWTEEGLTEDEQAAADLLDRYQSCGISLVEIDRTQSTPIDVTALVLKKLLKTGAEHDARVTFTGLTLEAATGASAQSLRLENGKILFSGTPAGDEYGQLTLTATVNDVVVTKTVSLTLRTTARLQVTLPAAEGITFVEDGLVDVQIIMNDGQRQIFRTAVSNGNTVEIKYPVLAKQVALIGFREKDAEGMPFVLSPVTLQADGTLAAGTPKDAGMVTLDLNGGYWNGNIGSFTYHAANGEIFLLADELKPTKAERVLAGWVSVQRSEDGTIAGETPIDLYQPLSFAGSDFLELKAKWNTSDGQPETEGQYHIAVGTLGAGVGTVNVPSYATPDSTVTVTVTMSDTTMAVKYLALTMGGSSWSVGPNEDGTFSFTMPYGDVTLNVQTESKYVPAATNLRLAETEDGRLKLYWDSDAQSTQTPVFRVALYSGEEKVYSEDTPLHSVDLSTYFGQCVANGEELCSVDKVEITSFASTGSGKENSITEFPCSIDITAETDALKGFGASLNGSTLTVSGLTPGSFYVIRYQNSNSVRCDFLVYAGADGTASCTKDYIGDTTEGYVSVRKFTWSGVRELTANVSYTPWPADADRLHVTPAPLPEPQPIELVTLHVPAPAIGTPVPELDSSWAESGAHYTITSVQWNNGGVPYEAGAWPSVSLALTAHDGYYFYCGKYMNLPDLVSIDREDVTCTVASESGNYYNPTSITVNVFFPCLESIPETPTLTLSWNDDGDDWCLIVPESQVKEGFGFDLVGCVTTAEGSVTHYGLLSKPLPGTTVLPLQDAAFQGWNMTFDEVWLERSGPGYNEVTGLKLDRPLTIRNAEDGLNDLRIFLTENGLKFTGLEPNGDYKVSYYGMPTDSVAADEHGEATLDMPGIGFGYYLTVFRIEAEVTEEAVTIIRHEKGKSVELEMAAYTVESEDPTYDVSQVMAVCPNATISCQITGGTLQVPTVAQQLIFTAHVSSKNNDSTGGGAAGGSTNGKGENRQFRQVIDMKNVSGSVIVLPVSGWVQFWNVSYQLNGGKVTLGEQSWQDYYHEELAERTPTFPTPQKKGYTFGGWYVAGTTEQVDTNTYQLPETTTGASFEAKWYSDDAAEGSELRAIEDAMFLYSDSIWLDLRGISAGTDMTARILAAAMKDGSAVPSGVNVSISGLEAANDTSVSLALANNAVTLAVLPTEYEDYSLTLTFTCGNTSVDKNVQLSFSGTVWYKLTINAAADTSGILWTDADSTAGKDGSIQLRAEMSKGDAVLVTGYSKGEGKFSIGIPLAAVKVYLLGHDADGNTYTYPVELPTNIETITLTLTNGWVKLSDSSASEGDTAAEQ